MARAFHAASPLPFPSKKNSNFQWLLKRGAKIEHDKERVGVQEEEADEEEEVVPFSTPLSGDAAEPAASVGGKKRASSSSSADTLARLRSVFVAVITHHRRRRNRGGRLGSCVTGTIFGRRRGHVHLALQTDPRSPPVLLVELAASTGALVREMSSGLVRLALECERRHVADGGEKQARRLLEEPMWRAYCNGRKCGYAVRRECGADDWKVLSAVEPVSVGAGVLPADDSAGAGAGEGDLMYMRAKFERVVGSKDSEAFYMMNPDGNGGPELSIYLLRV